MAPGKSCGAAQPQVALGAVGVPHRGTWRWSTPGLGTPPSPSALNPECLSQAFVKVRNLLEKTMAEDPQNLKISLEETESKRAQQGHFPQRLSQPLSMGSSERPTVPADPDPGVASRPCLQGFEHGGWL